MPHDPDTNRYPERPQSQDHDGIQFVQHARANSPDQQHSASNVAVDGENQVDDEHQIVAAEPIEEMFPADETAEGIAWIESNAGDSHVAGPSPAESLETEPQTVEQPPVRATGFDCDLESKIEQQKPVSLTGLSTEDEHFEAEISSERSWPFRLIDIFVSTCGWCFGFASLIVGLAVLSVIPIVQILTFGYFLEVTGRMGRTGRVREGFIGIRKAARVGSIVAGTWIMLLPIRYLSTLWYASHLLDPGSQTTSVLRVLQIIFTVLIIAHIVAAWYCGGRFRHFFWPIVAPFSLAVWVMRYIAATPPLRRILNQTVGTISPRLVQDFCNVKPITDWFLPAILLENLVSGKLFSRACDGLWDFVTSLRLPYYFWLGLRGLVGSLAFLIVPALLFIGASYLPGGLAVFAGIYGIVYMSVVIIYLPFAQAHFATEGKLSAMFNFRGFRHAFVRAPLRFWFALLCLLLLALPLFLFQIEKTYEELEWLESLVFMMLMLPARFLVGWAYARGRHREKKSIWPLTWGTRLAQLPLAFTFVLILFVTRYTSMNGVWNVFDQPAFLIPAPFTEWPF